VQHQVSRENLNVSSAFALSLVRNIRLRFSTRYPNAQTFRRVRSARQHHHIASPDQIFIGINKKLLPFIVEKRKSFAVKSDTCLCKILDVLSAKLNSKGNQVKENQSNKVNTSAN
jgi:hypothetical protein